jgi:S-adenosylmethionine:tRNA ribosyltransferase-isomerase
MRVDRFDFDLPRDRIAERPAQPRDAARLLDVRPDNLADRHFADLPGLLHRGDRLVVNDTKVIPARLEGRRGEARIEVTLHMRLDAGRWRAFARPAKRLKPGDRIIFSEDLSAQVEDRDAGEVTLAFDRTGAELDEGIERNGVMPLPPYITRTHGPDDRDHADYQTMFAADPGAVAAPTAALHFTPRLVSALEINGIDLSFVTLHVGAGTFLPVKVDDTDDHKMHAEIGTISPETATEIQATRDAGGRIVAVGTTALRLLESASDADGTVQAFDGATSLFITPGYRFRAVDLLLTNFHLPRSTLFMLVAAFSGLERMQRAYAHAIAEGYRFYSYGDACLLRPDAS